MVLVGGLGDALEVWKTVQPRIAGFARVVSCDRAGLGQSEPDGAPPTPRHVATQLHDLLHKAGINPPYVLVGHSIGGPHIRMFAGLYPVEVAGMVYVDPTNFTQTRADQLAIWSSLGAGEAGLKAEDEQFEQGFAESASGHLGGGGGLTATEEERMGQRGAGPGGVGGPESASRGGGPRVRLRI